MRVLIAAGGTGGHIYPGIAVAKEIMRRSSNARVLFVGTRRGLETRLVPQAGFNLETIRSAGLNNVGLAAKLRGLRIIPQSLAGARRILRQFRPDVVVGAGGYVSGPVLLMASLEGIPTLVMESNALPGLTNRILAYTCTAAAVSFEESLKFFRGKGVLTGNPVRDEFTQIEPKRRDANAETNVLIFGGSQGARAINEATVAALPLLGEHKSKLRIVHQTGEQDFERVAESYTQASWTDRGDVRRYIDDMVAEFAKADIIICRAGATTSAELVAAGKAAIMIPFPLAADDHQRRNAEALAEKGAARMILQADLTGERLASEIIRFADAPELITEMEHASRHLRNTNATHAVVDLIEKLVVRSQ